MRTYMACFKVGELQVLGVAKRRRWHDPGLPSPTSRKAKVFGLSFQTFTAYKHFSELRVGLDLEASLLVDVVHDTKSNDFTFSSLTVIGPKQLACYKYFYYELCFHVNLTIGNYALTTTTGRGVVRVAVRILETVVYVLLVVVVAHASCMMDDGQSRRYVRSAAAEPILNISRHCSPSTLSVRTMKHN